MNIVELEFCEKFEAMLTQLNVLKAIESNLTIKGKDELQKTQSWIDFNTEKYFTITGKK